MYLNKDGITRIGLVGKMRAGKDTVAEYLWLDRGFDYPIAFGDALKRIAHEIFPDVPKEPKPRELYQFMNVMRDYDEDVWVKQLDRTYKAAINFRDVTGVVVTDARQENEVRWLKDNGFTLIKVDAPIELRKERAKTDGDDFNEEHFEHKTEQFVDEVEADFTVVNDGDLSDLHRKIDEILTKIGR